MTIVSKYNTVKNYLQVITFHLHIYILIDRQNAKDIHYRTDKKKT